MRTWSYVFGAAATALLFVACSGSSDISIPRSLEDAGPTLVDSGGTPPDDSGIVCAPCETSPPGPNCTGTGRCGCAPYTCTDAGSDPVDAGSDAGVDLSCTWSPTANPCAAGMYCKTDNKCGKGTCVPIPAAEANNRAPVCGCDGVTYWNASVAAKHGMSLLKNNGCGNDSIECGGLAGPNCPNGAVCNYRVGGEQACKITDVTGLCWMPPATCPTISLTNKGVACSGGGCDDDCKLIKSGAPWYSVQAPCLP